MRIFTTSISYYLYAGKVFSTIHIPRTIPVILTAVPSGRLESEWLGGDVFKPPSPALEFCISDNANELAFMSLKPQPTINDRRTKDSVAEPFGNVLC